MGPPARRLISVLLLAAVAAAAFTPNPVADPKAVVVAGNARFTILTPQLIRMEWSSTLAWRDAASFSVLNRLLPVPDFSVSQVGDWIVIKTAYVQLRYLQTSTTTFSTANLMATVAVAGQSVNWNLSNGTVGNLFGTFRTLDGNSAAVYNGSSGYTLDCALNTRPDQHCSYGVLSRNGVVLVDDTNRPSFTADPWPWLINGTKPTPDPASAVCQIPDAQKRDCGMSGITEHQCQQRGCCWTVWDGTPQCYYTTVQQQDLYLFGHGHDYKQAMADFVAMAGPIPLPPRYMLGVFFSRYWAYSDEGEMEIVGEYEKHGIPLDVLVTDMDWHITFYKEAAAGKKDQAGMTIGWSGFTWDAHLFPEPTHFLDWCKARNLRNTLNIHPASGMQPWEDKYAVMAVAMGIDPKTQIYVPFNCTDPKFVRNWLQLVMKPLSAEGVDFWWLDWQQGEDWIDMPDVNPTFWLNYLITTDPYRWGTTLRPHLLHRWGGLGNHRYECGFSGDVVPSWSTLEYQPYFTLSAANVGFGLWSHDLGGHTQPCPAELYTRWVQWGAFSPMVRTHCTKDALNDRRIWMYPPENFRIMREALLLRAALTPYLYSAARTAYDTGVALLRGLYFDYPEANEAYTFRQEYLFGADMVVAPVYGPVDANTQLHTKQVWIPPGTWIQWLRGQAFTGPQTVTLTFELDEIPVFVRAGAILPLRPRDHDLEGGAQFQPPTLELHVFPGAAAGAVDVYEDDGVSQDYQQSASGSSVTHIHYLANSTLADSDGGSRVTFIIDAAQGRFTGQLTQRAYEVHFLNSWPPTAVTVNGVALSAVPFDALPPLVDAWAYDGDTLSLVVYLVTPRPVASPVTVVYTTANALTDPLLVSGYVGRLARALDVKALLDNQWGITTVYDEDYFDLLNASEAGQRITAAPATAPAELAAFLGSYQAGIAEVKALSALSTAVMAQAVAFLNAN